MGFDREFNPLRSNQNRANLGLCKVADDVESLEFAPEFLQMQDGHHQQQAAVVAAVHGSRYRIHVQFLAQLETVAFEGYFIGIYLGAQAAVTRQAF